MEVLIYSLSCRPASLRQYSQAEHGKPGGQQLSQEPGDRGVLAFIRSAVLCPAKRPGEERLIPFSWLGTASGPCLDSLLAGTQNFSWGWAGGPVPRHQIKSEKSPWLGKQTLEHGWPCQLISLQLSRGWPTVLGIQHMWACHKTDLSRELS